MIVNNCVSRRLSWKTSAVLALFAVVVGPVALLAQDERPVPIVAETRGNDPELLKVIITQSRANLGKIQDWRGRARIRMKRVNKVATDGKPTEQVMSVLVTFVYNLNRGDIHSDLVLEESANLDEQYSRELASQYGRFNPVCWQFPLRENIIGSAFKHFYNLLKKVAELPEGKITRSGGLVRFWIGPSDDTCNVYEVDLDKGASLVNWQTLQNSKVTTSFELEPQLLDDIWIPRRTTRVCEGADFTEEETIEWFENEINELH